MLRTALGVAIALTIAGCHTAEESTWFMYKAPDGAFALSFPAEPVADVQNLGTVFGRLEMHVVSFETNGDQENEDRAFIVLYGDLPARLLEDADPQGILDGLRDGMLGTIDGRLLEEDDAALGKIPGRAVRLASATGEAQVLGRIYLAGLRIYQLMSVGAPSQAGDEDALRFLKSFQLRSKR